jgi:hypothetical protein
MAVLWGEGGVYGCHVLRVHCCLQRVHSPLQPVPFLLGLLGTFFSIGQLSTAQRQERHALLGLLAGLSFGSDGGANLIEQSGIPPIRRLKGGAEAFQPCRQVIDH